MKKTILFMAILVSCVWLSLMLKVQAETPSYKIWFYNSANWPNVNAYIWGDQGEEFGPWPGTPANQNSDSKWWYVELSINTPFNIIFNSGGAQAGNVYITEPKECFLTVEADKVYNTKEEAEEAVKNLNLDNTGETRIWFYNTNGWKKVYLYIYGTLKPDVLGPWPGTPVNREGDSHWYSIVVPSGVPFNAIFNDGTDANKAEAYINDEINVYITVVTDVKFPDKESAESSIDVVLPIPFDDENIEIPEPNFDIEEQKTIIIIGKDSDKIFDLAVIMVSSLMGISIVSLSTLIFLKRKT